MTRKWYGDIAIATDVETESGYFEPQLEVRKYYGDIVTNRRSYQPGADNGTSTVRVNNSISVIMDANLYNNLSRIEYIEFGGALWKISNIEINGVRVILSLGDIYTGEGE